jgi:zinc protease
MKKALSLFLAVGFLAAGLAWAQVEKPSDLKYPVLNYTPPDPQAFRTVLSNGLRAYLQEAHGLPLVNLAALVNFGKLYVPRDKQGLDALLGETLIKGGTAARDGEAIEDRIDFLGGTLSFYVGERTSTLSLSVLSRDLDEGLDLFFDVLRHAAFREEALELAKRRLIEQLRQVNDSPSQILAREYEKLLYGDHPLTWQPTRQSYEGLAAADLKSVLDKYFFPKNIILAASGDFDSALLKAGIDKATAGWPNRTLALPPFSRDFPKPEPGVYFIQKAINQGYVSLGHLGLEETNPDYFAVQVMNFILGGGSFTSRITTQVRSNEGLSYNQGSRFTYRWGFPGTLSGYVQTKSSTVGYAISLILDELDRIRREPVSDAEMETAVDYYLESFSNFFQSPLATMTTFAELEMSGRPLDYYQTYRDKIKAVTKARVQEVARKYIHPDQAVILIVGDWEPCNQGSDKFAGPLDKFGKVHRLRIIDPLTGQEEKNP